MSCRVGIRLFHSHSFSLGEREKLFTFSEHKLLKDHQDRECIRIWRPEALLLPLLPLSSSSFSLSNDSQCKEQWKDEASRRTVCVCIIIFLSPLYHPNVCCRLRLA